MHKITHEDGGSENESKGKDCHHGQKQPMGKTVFPLSVIVTE